MQILKLDDYDLYTALFGVPRLVCAILQASRQHWATMSHGSLSLNAPYEGSPLQNLTLDNSRCNNDSCQAFYDAHQLSQKEVSHNHQFEYGHYVSWYLLVVLCQLLLETVHSSSVPCSSRWSVWKEAYRRVEDDNLPQAPRQSGSTNPWPHDFLSGLSILYCCILTFAVRPYYRAHRGFGSPPLAVRTGLMATALTPWIVALSGKANIITWLTGIGPEKLNVLHRWMSWLCLGLSIVHTIPFIVAPLRDGGPAQLRRQYHKKGGYEVSRRDSDHARCF